MKVGKVKFRKAVPADVDRIMEVVEEGRAALKANGIDQWQKGYPNRAVVEADVAHGESFVAVTDAGVIAAIAMVSLHGERIYDDLTGGSWLTSSTSEAPRYAVIHRVAVSTSCKGMGAGRFLMEGAERYAREQGCESVRIDTHASNASMRRLLDRCGYTPCGTVIIAHAEGGSPERMGYEKLL